MKGKLLVCHVCGEEKGWNDFKNVPYFTSYKKRRLQWCRECQKMYLEMKRKEELVKEERNRKINFLVSF
jgi:hypothetical protein